MSLPTNARWLDHFGKCCVCRTKKADGTLMSDRNDKLGPYCERCAKRAINNYGKRQ